MQYGAFLGIVDFFTREHRPDKLIKTCFPSQFHEQGDSLDRDPVLGIIKQDFTQLHRESLKPPGVLVKQVPHMQL